MLKTNDIHKLAKLLKVDASDLEAKIKSEGEEDITLPELEVFTKTDLETRLKNEKSTSYNEGKEAGIEMLVKAKKSELGYDFEGRDLDSLLEFHETKIKESGAKPNERIVELESDISKLNKTHLEAISERERLLNEYRSKYNSSLINNKLLQIIPTETTIAKEDILTLFNANYQTELDEQGNIQVKQNGETVKDPTTASPRDLKDVFDTFITERKYISKEPGRGGDNEFGGKGGSKPKDLDSFNEQWEKSGKSMNGSEYEVAYAKFREQK